MRKHWPFLYDFVFPNYLLPNATPSEMGVIHYIHNLFSKRLSDKFGVTLFDENLESGSSTLELIFSKTKGMWPNSCGMNGSHFKTRCFNHLLNIEELDLFNGRKKYDKYIYPIKLTPHFDKFAANVQLNNTKDARKINGDFFWKHISEQALEDIENRKAFILLDYVNENFIDRHTFVNLHYALANSGLPASQILLTINSFNAKEVYESWFQPNERLLEVHNFPFLLVNMSHHYTESPSLRITEDKFHKLKGKLRKHYYLFKIRRARPHRMQMLFRLAQEDILQLGNWSCLSHLSFEQAAAEASQYYPYFDYDKVRSLLPTLPKTLEFEDTQTFDNTSGWGDMHSIPSHHAYFYIASETYVHGEYKSLSEKVFKPLINFHPFVFIAFPGAIKLLQDLGFQTFHPWIDESYDSEIDDRKRFEMIANEVKRLCSMPLEELHEWYWSMEHILIHNHRHMLDQFRSQPHIVDFINYLDNKLHR